MVLRSSSPPQPFLMTALLKYVAYLRVAYNTPVATFFLFAFAITTGWLRDDATGPIEGGRRCVLREPRMLGDESDNAIQRTMATCAGVQCTELAGVRWSVVIDSERVLGI